MKRKILLLLLLLLSYVFVYSSQDNYSKLSTRTWSELNGKNYKIIREEPENNISVVKDIDSGELFVVLW